MKKIIYLSILFCSAYVSAQKSYEQYKQEREYSQRYANEQKQQFNKNVEKTLNRYGIVINQYVNLATKNRSEQFVKNNYSQLSNERMNLLNWINMNSKYMTYFRWINLKKCIINIL